jgi:hypothetical protein
MNTIQQLNNYLTFLGNSNGNEERINQANSLFNCLNEFFTFDKIICIEAGASQNVSDGCFGFYLAEIVDCVGGEFHSVDSDKEVIEKSVKFYSEQFPSLHVKSYFDDSINFLSNFNGHPNLVHLDSWDLNLKNPVPSMLHGWLEFNSIEDKMPSGSIILVDDNYFKGTWVHWNHMKDGEVINTETINIDYEIVGKGSLIYHYCKNYESNWKIIGDHYYPGSRIKLIIQKK